MENFPRGVCVGLQLIERCVGGCIDEPKDHALIFCRRQLVRGHFEHWNREQGETDPDHVNGRTYLQGPIKQSPISIAETIEVPIDEAAKSFVGVPAVEELRADHRRECQGHHSRDENSAR